MINGSSSRAFSLGGVSRTHEFILTSCEVVSLGSEAGQWSADGLSFASTPTIAYERPATPSTPNKPPHLRNRISFRVCINLSKITSILTHVPAGPTPEAKAEIVWCKITEAHCQVDIRIGTVGWSGRGNDVVVSF